MKKIISTVLVLVLALLAAAPVGAQAAKKNKGPNTAADSSAYIHVLNSEGINNYLYADKNLSWVIVTEVPGVSYDRKTNTLTLNNYDAPDMVVEANEMGSDFKVKLVGTSNIQCLSIWGFAYAGCCTITGKGTLNVNKAKKSDYGIVLNAEDSYAVLTVDKNCKVNAWSKKAGQAVAVLGTTVKKGIVIKGKSSAKIATAKDKAADRKEFYIYNIENKDKASFEQFEIYKKDGKEYGITQYNDGTKDVYRWVKADGKWAYLFVERTEDISSYEPTGKTRTGASLTLVKTSYVKKGTLPVWSFYNYDAETGKSVSLIAVGEEMGKAKGLGKVYKVKTTYEEDPGNLGLKTHATYNINIKGKTFSSKKK